MWQVIAKVRQAKAKFSRALMLKQPRSVRVTALASADASGVSTRLLVYMSTRLHHQFVNRKIIASPHPAPRSRRAGRLGRPRVLRGQGGPSRARFVLPS